MCTSHSQESKSRYKSETVNHLSRSASEDAPIGSLLYLLAMLQRQSTIDVSVSCWAEAVEVSLHLERISLGSKLVHKY
jgi:hypothetical protein